MTLNEKKKLYRKANDAYNNGLPSPLTDKQFDDLEREIRKADPSWSALHKTGAKVGKKVEVRLPVFMPSLHKRYPEDIAKWTAKQGKTLLAAHKLDGSALLGRFQNGVCTFLATRGDGTNGKDISFLIPYLKLPKIKDKDDTLVRFEALMKQKTFLKKYSVDVLGEKKGFDNARNMVAGLLNRQDASPYLKDVDFVVLGVYYKEILDGLSWAQDVGLQAVTFSLVPHNRNFEELLAAQRKMSDYEIDGLVLIPPKQMFNYTSADRPKFTIAFKVNDDQDAVEATVEEVIWQISRTNRWTPKIKVKPVKMKGVTVTYATAHNAQWLTERKIGVGAVVKLVRSGDVIPKIVSVVEAAEQPTHPPGQFYEEGVHYYAVEREQGADVRAVHHFFSTLGIEHIAQKTVAKLYEAGFTTVLHHLNSYGVRMKGYTEAGIGDAMTSKIYDECSRVFHKEGVTLLQLMDASNCFESFGQRKLQMIQTHFMGLGDPDPLKTYVKKTPGELFNGDLWRQVEEIKGMGEASARQFFEGMQRFKVWFHPILKTKLLKINAPEAPTKKVKNGLPLSGQFVSFTGYRDEDHEAAIEEAGADLVSFGGKTTILLIKKGGKASTKVDKARAKGIKVCTFEELMK